MAAKKRKKHARPTSLSYGRPLFAQKPKATLSSDATRHLIRTHHTLQKQLAKAIKDGDTASAATIEAQIEQQGGLKSYQQASIEGQSPRRGGDTSKQLIDWLKETKTIISGRKVQLKMLEIGALSPFNACSRTDLLDVTRIDLHSQHPKIEQQDFMKRPIPSSDDDKFDIISLSLVLNFVPEAIARGEMLERTTEFLRISTRLDISLLPCLFLVLPAPCLQNSRYMTEERLEALMSSLGYSCKKAKYTSKLAYSLWKLTGTGDSAPLFPKAEINPGKSRNNFSIVLC
ncbi:hypothetical protein M501DRAFT_929867 [Patellaria atrata CBS 101060]|uniref:25S rRNA adenine-N(1) methyltransferase n=1 Tax=Patellaria atrata CBS 101060 TaxID=1346257 RepID=A0A9P4VU03_9PEZI|nr:hypothetical protein M501DRAFT_929867 [Patellaria atrata CBS 101060]